MYFILFAVSLVVVISATNSLKRLVAEMMYYVSSETLNPTHSHAATTDRVDRLSNAAALVLDSNVHPCEAKLLSGKAFSQNCSCKSFALYVGTFDLSNE